VTDQRGDDAAERARAARQRVAELGERLRRLQSGQPATGDDVRQAEQAAAAERARSLDAHRRAGAAHLRAAMGHRQAADTLQAAGQSEQAAEHRRKAEADEEAAGIDAGLALDEES
jgi:hypothetical protein